MSVLGVIPARGGSKGIPGKNTIDVCGKPLIAWTIEQANASDLIDRVVVSSDSAEILRTALEWGAGGVLPRPAELAGDNVKTEPVIHHVLDQVGHYDTIVLLQPTSPIRQPLDIDTAIAQYNGGPRTVFGACRVEGLVWMDRWPPAWHCDDHMGRPLRQNKRHTVMENGSIYVFSRKTLDDWGERMGSGPEPYMMHPLDSFQVDEPEDLEIVRTLLPIRLGLEG